MNITIVSFYYNKINAYIHASIYVALSVCILSSYNQVKQAYGSVQYVDWLGFVKANR